MLETQGLDVSIAGTPILRGAGLKIRPGTTVGLVGRNGAGKTTFMRSVMGLLTPTSGHILLDGEDVTAQPAHTRARLGVGYMPEDRRLIPEFSVEENILLPVRALGEAVDPKRLQWI